jgi:signal transduction histidine kinase
MKDGRADALARQGHPASRFPVSTTVRLPGSGSTAGVGASRRAQVPGCGNRKWALPVETPRFVTAILLPMEYARGVGTTQGLAPRDTDEHPLVAAERLRIARELHDVVSYGFATISMQAGIAAHIAETRPEQAIEALHVIRDAGREVLGELRVILGQLREDSDAPEPARGIGRLSVLVDRARNAGVRVSIRVAGRPRPVPVGLDIAVYRIVQEALTNVLRHAPGALVRVMVGYETHGVRVTVEDDGDARKDGPREGSGYGIVGMRERASALGGDFDAGPLPDGGFCVHAFLPLGRR